MNTAVIAFTARGMQTARAIEAYFGTPSCRVWCRMKTPPDVGEGVQLCDSLSDWTRDRFGDSALLIFVGATGIAVRAIAPYLVSKAKDPAVLSVDEQGQFVISLVSGHIGGANAQAAKLARALGALPVITTATDLNGKFAVDEFAARNHLAISDLKLTKYVAADLLADKWVHVTGEVAPEGRFPGGISFSLAPDGNFPEEKAQGTLPPGDRSDIHVHIGIFVPEGERVLTLTPRVVSVGVGCRKGVPERQLCAFLREELARAQIAPGAVEQICSIDIKQDEPGIKALAREWQVPFVTFSARQLMEVAGDFTASAFVAARVGVDNVCERSAVLGSGGGRLILRKLAREGMTLALAVREWRIGFE